MSRGDIHVKRLEIEEFEFNPLKETNLGMNQALFDKFKTDRQHF